MKHFLFIFLLIGFAACAQKQAAKKPVKIYPFYPYGRQHESINEQNDSTFSRYYIIYNLYTEDTSDIKKIIQPYADSVINANPNKKYFSLSFYETGRNFDSTYRETKQEPLFDYTQNRVATHSISIAVGNSYWAFFKNGKIISDMEVKIENIPENDTLFKKQP